MVHELHKVGYQRLRINAGVAPTGLSWRCVIHPAVAVEGVEPARYTSAAGTRYFDWTDADQDTARQMAVKFVERFPALCAAGAGLDYAYAGWFTWVLGKAEGGKLPIFFADYPIDIDPADLPPPPPPE
jgi:hypothetical protein